MSKSEKASALSGIRMEFTSNGLFLYQCEMLDYNHSSIPIEPKAITSNLEKSNCFIGQYRELIGSLIYLVYVSRPDILCAVNCLI